jgi:hypothetical protein
MTKTGKMEAQGRGILFRTFEFLSLDIVSNFVLRICHFQNMKTIRQFDLFF